MNKATKDLRGRVALVTGAGRGIGRVIAASLASAGASVALLARTSDEVEDSARVLDRAGADVMPLTADVTDIQAVEYAVERIERRFGPIDLLVNNAGTSGPMGPLWEVEAGAWLRTMDINLRGTFVCTRFVLPGMILRGQGRIINMASHAGIHRWPLVSAYAVSKSAVIKFTENLAVETRPHGVVAFAVHPGVVTAGMTEAVLKADAPAGSSAARVATWFRQQLADGRGLPPERAGDLVLTLASGRADALSGRYLTAYDDIEDLIRRAREIQRNDLRTLGLREVQPAAVRLGRRPKTLL
jgi:NAD(P)-dependent dehydrogenase (short-subunit alcohol dehydrogenase family)